MVLINLKSTLGATNTNDEFLYETKASTKVDDLIESLVDIHNARVRSFMVADAVRALATCGVAKRPENDETDDRVRGRKPSSACRQPLFCLYFFESHNITANDDVKSPLPRRENRSTKKSETNRIRKSIHLGRRPTLTLSKF